MNTIPKAHRHYREAAEALQKAVAAEYPIGAFVDVNIGKSRIDAEVVGHPSCWWYQPDTIRVRNIYTGKTRTVSTTSEWQDLRKK